MCLVGICKGFCTLITSFYVEVVYYGLLPVRVNVILFIDFQIVCCQIVTLHVPCKIFWFIANLSECNPL